MSGHQKENQNPYKDPESFIDRPRFVETSICLSLLIDMSQSWEYHEVVLALAAAAWQDGDDPDAVESRETAAILNECAAKLAAQMRTT